MVVPFHQSRLKIKRANKHIADIDSIIRSLPDNYAAEIDTNIETGQPSIKHELPGIDLIAEQIALIAGDAIHNLRTALDYAWIDTIKRFMPSALDKHSKFPVRETRQEVEEILKGREIDIACPELYKRVVSDIKPYIGGNNSIRHLHDLDVSDKHLLLTPLITYGGLHGIAFKNKETGEIRTGGSIALPGPGPYYIDAPKDTWHIENKGKLSLAVVFNDPPFMEGMEVLSSLQTLSIFTFQTVELLEFL